MNLLPEIAALSQRLDALEAIYAERAKENQALQAHLERLQPSIIDRCIEAAHASVTRVLNR